MKLVFGSIILFVFLFIIPIVIGQNGLKDVNISTFAGKVCFSNLFGFLIILAIWQVVVLPMAIINISFRTICVIYIIFLFVILLFSIKYLKKNKKLFLLRKDYTKNRIQRKKWFMYFMVVAFVILFAIQLYYALLYSRTYMAADGYAVFSSMAIQNDVVNGTGMYNGEVLARVGAEWLQRTMQTHLYFPAFLSLISGVHSATIYYTVMYGYVLLLSYEAYFLLSDTLFKKNESRFLLLYFIALLYVFGYHSHYSLTFRMLGPNSEGKAILAVVVTPFVFWYMKQIIEQEYRRTLGIHLLIISIGAVSLTLGTCYTFAALLFSMVIFRIIRNKELKQLLYCFWGLAYPGICAMLYLLLKM